MKKYTTQTEPKHILKMKKIGISFFLLTLFCAHSALYSQNSVQVEIYPRQKVILSYEKFDMNAFRNQVAQSGSLDYVYTEADGTQKRISNLRKGLPIEVYEVPPLPAVYRIFKEFYPNGSLKRKGIYLPHQFPIGKWLECDEQGNCSVINYDLYRGAFGYNSLLKALEDKGYINTLGGGDNWSFIVWYNDNSHQWGVKLQKGSKYRMLQIDANSGDILSEAEHEVKPTNTSVYGGYNAFGDY